MADCKRCGTARAPFLMDYCKECEAETRKEEREQRNEIEKKQDEARVAREKELTDVILTTAPSIQDRRVIKTVDVITAECVFGMNIFRDIFAGFSDIFGGRSEATQSVLRDARKTCLAELRKEAVSVGANAVIAIDLDYSEFSGGGKSMLFLVASGTAVVLEEQKIKGSGTYTGGRAYL